MNMGPLAQLAHIRRRRRELSSELEIWRQFEKWEETCVPSYCHRNWLAAYVSWRRLFKAVDLARKYGRPGPILDFGASVGELGQLLNAGGAYHVIEQQDAPAEYLHRSLPAAVRQTLETAPKSFYATVFALDALEHNETYEDLLALLSTMLADNGVLVISGPTENMLYRLGRKMAGYEAHYHVTDIAAIERAASNRLRLKARRTVPMGIPLFRLSVWERL